MLLMPLTLDHCLPWAELLALSFDRTVSETAQVLTWLHEAYRVTAWGAWEADRLVAQYACLRRRVIVNGRPHEAGMSLNMSVHPDFRGRGLIKQVSKPVYEQLQAEGVLLGVGFSNAEGVKVDRHSKGYGYQVVGQMTSTLAYLRPLPATQSLTLSETMPAGDWPVGGNADAIHFEVSAQSIYHRYMRHPFRRYRYGIWEEGGEILGIVIYRTLRQRPGVALLAAYGHDLRELLRRWSSSVCATGVRFVHTLTTPNADLRRALAQISLSTPIPYTRSPYFLTLKPLSGAAENLLDFAAWDCMGGDIL